MTTEITLTRTNGTRLRVQPDEVFVITPSDEPGKPTSVRLAGREIEVTESAEDIIASLPVRRFVPLMRQFGGVTRLGLFHVERIESIRTDWRGRSTIGFEAEPGAEIVAESVPSVIAKIADLGPVARPTPAGAKPAPRRRHLRPSR